jgi:hypothetical protein
VTLEDIYCIAVKLNGFITLLVDIHEWCFVSESAFREPEKPSTAYLIIEAFLLSICRVTLMKAKQIFRYIVAQFRSHFNLWRKINELN